MTDTFRELDRRYHDRIHVRLLWHARDNRVIVTVADEKTGERFSVEVRAGEHALDVFEHPFAYAAWHGVKPATRKPSRRRSSGSAPHDPVAAHVDALGADREAGRRPSVHLGRHPIARVSTVTWLGPLVPAVRRGRIPAWSDRAVH